MEWIVVDRLVGRADGPSGWTTVAVGWGDVKSCDEIRAI